MTSTAESHPSFKLVNEKKISSLKLRVQEFTHGATGAQHIHLSTDSEENVFLVALRTVPEDSTGVAHILEHTALCGSKKFPVRDPFFMMTRRSLNTFMNAFTSSDWTAYPLASLNQKDFNNLLDVYLDAVFFSRLHPLDFAQEGHRLEFKVPDDPNSELEFKGVVFNEMKGAMSSISSQLWHTLTKYLFPTSTYHFNSGGEPADIPDLSYEQLLTFYKTHYHPSNAIFMTYGNIPASVHQEKFESQVMHSFERLDKTIAVQEEKRYFAPIRVEESYANDDADLDEKTHVVVGWLLGESADPHETLRSQLLASVLMDNSAAPLMHALESTDLGNAPSPLCGLDDSQKELSFICGLAGAKAKTTDDIEQLILKTLESVAENGIGKTELESALHQLELHQREVGGDSYPYGLQLILKSLTSANHRGDPTALLDIDDAIEKLRSEISDPEFIKKLVRELLIDNPHRVTLTLSPDREITQRKNAAEKARLSAIKEKLTKTQVQEILDATVALKTRQESVDDPGSLPKVGLSDVPTNERSVNPQLVSTEPQRISQYASATNGLVYQQAIFDLPNLEESQIGLLPLYSACVTELGAGDQSYLEMQKKQSAISGGVSAFHSLRGGVNKVDNASGYFVYSGKSLARNQNQLLQLLDEIVNGARFDEFTRIQEIITQITVGMEQSVTGNGHVLAMNAAASGISFPSYLGNKLSGLEAIKAVKQINEKNSDNSLLESFSKTLESIHQQIIRQSQQFLYIGEEESFNTFDREAIFSSTKSASNPFNGNSFTQQVINQAWICNSQVNFCAKAYPTVPVGHEDSATLVILGHFLRNGFLHQAIREQGGAYGGGASHDSNGGSFRFYSYRDPRLLETLHDFDASIDWFLTNKHSEDKLEEAILGTISGIDRSESPAGQAKRCFHSELHDRSLEVRDTFRQRVLSTTLDDLHRVCDHYLKAEYANTAVVTGKHGVNLAKSANLELLEL